MYYGAPVIYIANYMYVLEMFQKQNMWSFTDLGILKPF